MGSRQFRLIGLVFGVLFLTGLAAPAGDGFVRAEPRVPLRPLASGWSTHGILVSGNGNSVYGWANLKPSTWLGMQVIHANFVVLEGGSRPIGNVAIIPTSTPGLYVWISDQGPSGTIQTLPSGIQWRDASGGSGLYRPL